MASFVSLVCSPLDAFVNALARLAQTNEIELSAHFLRVTTVNSGIPFTKPNLMSSSSAAVKRLREPAVLAIQFEIRNLRGCVVSLDNERLSISMSQFPSWKLNSSNSFDW